MSHIRRFLVSSVASEPHSSAKKNTVHDIAVHNQAAAVQAAWSQFSTKGYRHRFVALLTEDQVMTNNTTS